jgi:hypothetical protein
MLHLDDAERAVLINRLAGTIENDLFSTSERVQRLRSVLEKLRGRHGAANHLRAAVLLLSSCRCVALLACA